jgi:type IV secretory pathway VirB2 component (pilin)
MQSTQPQRRGRIARAAEQIWTALILALLSLQAHAQVGGDPISRLLNKGVDMLTNQWAVASAVITIAALGYRMKYGMMDKRKALYSIIGIVVVFGAVLIVDEIRV